MNYLLSLLSLSVLLMYTSGCGGGGAARLEEANRAGILILGNGVEVENLDPHTVTGVPEHNIITALIEGLVTENPQDLSVEPGTAERWEVSEDGLTYTFLLREDAKWSNGDPVSADDFLFSYKRMLSPNLASEYAYMYFVVENAQAYNEGTLKDFSEVGIKVVDPRTLQIKLASRTPYFLELLNHFSWFPVHPDTVLAHGAIDEPNTPWTKPGTYVGNGPFTLESWEINKSIVVKKSETYWDRAAVKLNQIVFKVTEDPNAEERSFQAGELHKTNIVPLDKIALYRDEKAEQIHFDPYLATYYYIFNTKKKPFDDLRVRQAFSMTIDRQIITERVLRTGEQPAYSYVPEHAGYQAEVRIEQDAEKARALLAEAGYPDGKDFPVVELLYNTSESHKIIAESIQNMWKTALNVEVRLFNQEWKAYMVTRREGNFHICRAGWTGDYQDPNTFLDMFMTGSGNNHSGWEDPAYDGFVRQAGQTTGEERMRLLHQAEKRLLEELPITPIYFNTTKYLMRPEVKGWYPTMLDHHPYKYVWLESSGS